MQHSGEHIEPSTSRLFACAILGRSDEALTFVPLCNPADLEAVSVPACKAVSSPAESDCPKYIRSEVDSTIPGSMAVSL